jgi:pimeloyl-ACP methyl ester carboxylesterase
MSEVVASDGVRLYAESHGSGVPILLSCGLRTTRENFRPQVAPLTGAGAQVILWDYRGHGKSESPEDPDAYSMRQVIDDLGRVLDWAAPGGSVVLGGHSFGGLASLHFAHAHPERVRALVLIDSGPGFKNPKAQASWEAMIERTVLSIESKGLPAFVESRAAVDLVGLRPELPAARAAARAIAAQDPAGLACFARRVAAPAPPVIDELAGIRVPALVIVGEKDDAFLRAAEVMAARLPRAQRVTLPEAGHLPNIEDADAFNTAVIRFLRELPPSPDRDGV